jgi:hypothetical protein
VRLRKTERGFLRGEFVDADGQACSIQESSQVEPRLWLGSSANGEAIHLGRHVGVRMHLDRKTARMLIPHLQRFVAQGDLRRIRAR